MSSDLDTVFQNVDPYTWITILPALISGKPEQSDVIIAGLLRAIRWIKLPPDWDGTLFHDSAAIMIKTLVPYCLSTDPAAPPPSFAKAWVTTTVGMATFDQIKAVLTNSSSTNDWIRLVPYAMSAAYRLVGNHMTGSEKKRVVMAAVFDQIVNQSDLTKAERLALLTTVPPALSAAIDTIYAVERTDLFPMADAIIANPPKCCTNCTIL